MPSRMGLQSKHTPYGDARLVSSILAARFIASSCSLSLSGATSYSAPGPSTPSTIFFFSFSSFFLFLLFTSFLSLFSFLSSHLLHPSLLDTPSSLLPIFFTTTIYLCPTSRLLSAGLRRLPSLSSLSLFPHPSTYLTQHSYQLSTRLYPSVPASICLNAATPTSNIQLFSAPPCQLASLLCRSISHSPVQHLKHNNLQNNRGYQDIRRRACYWLLFYLFLHHLHLISRLALNPLRGEQQPWHPRSHSYMPWTRPRRCTLSSCESFTFSCFLLLSVFR